MPRLFICYRREDGAGHAGRLADALEQAFGADSVFRDVDDIAPGAEFAPVIERGLADVVAVLVVIGPGWLNAAGPRGRRLDEADDLVRREIELALAADKPVLPVLVGGAAMPAAAALPPSLRPLAERQALVLADTAWRDDFARLRLVLEPLLAVGGAERPGVRRTVTAALTLFGLLLAGLLWWQLGNRKPPPDEVAAFAGVWEARVIYPWGDSYDERFEFALHGRELVGQASFLGVPRTIVSGRAEDGHIEFATVSTELSGADAPPRELRHRYRGTLPGRDAAGGGLRMTMESSGGFSDSPPVSFVARRRVAP